MLRSGVRKIAYSNYQGILIETTVKKLLDDPDVYYTAGSLDYGKLYQLRHYVLSRVNRD